MWRGRAEMSCVTRRGSLRFSSASPPAHGSEAKSTFVGPWCPAVSRRVGGDIVETADMGLGRPDTSVGESGRGSLVPGAMNAPCDGWPSIDPQAPERIKCPGGYDEK